LPLAGVRIANEADAYLFAVLVQPSELAQQLNKRALAEWVRERRVKGQRWIPFGKTGFSAYR
jgi:hypothetical protein